MTGKDAAQSADAGALPSARQLLVAWLAEHERDDGRGKHPAAFCETWGFSDCRLAVTTRALLSALDSGRARVASPAAQGAGAMLDTVALADALREADTLAHEKREWMRERDRLLARLSHERLFKELILVSGYQGSDEDSEAMKRHVS